MNSQLNQLHIKAILTADLLTYARAKSEVEVVDLVLTLREKSSATTDSAQRQQLTQLVRALVRLLPPDLHSLLTRAE